MTQFNTLVEEMKGKAVLGKDNHNGVYWFGEKELDMLITTTATRVREETIEEVKQKIESLRTCHVPADAEWFGKDDYSEGEYKLVPAKDPSKAMYCLTCERFLPEEGCLCGMVTVDKVLSTLNK